MSDTGVHYYLLKKLSASLALEQHNDNVRGTSQPVGSTGDKEGVELLQGRGGKQV